MQRAFITAVILVLTTTAFGQSNRRHHKPAEPETPAMPSAKQSDQMKKLTDTFAGMWKIVATVEKSAWFPNAGTSTGRSDIRSGPAGNSLIERSRSHGVMGLYAGFGLVWWDDKAAAYKGMWCDSLSPDGCDPTGSGQWQADGTLVFTSQMDMGQSKMQVKETYSGITADAFTFTTETSTDGGPVTKIMTIQYTREEPKTTVITPPASSTAPGNAEAPTEGTSK